MTDTHAPLPDLIVRTTARGDRFGWRIVTLEGDRFLSSDTQAETSGGPVDFESRSDARRDASRVLLGLIESQTQAPAGEVVTMYAPMGPARLAA